MRAILFFALVFSLVSCEDLIPHIISLKEYPTLVGGLGNDLEIDFIFKVHSKVTIKEVTDEPSSKFKLLILPPPYLKYKSEKTKFASYVATLSTGPGGGAASSSSSAKSTLAPGAVKTKCEMKNRLTVLKALEEDAAAIFGFYTKTALKSELSTLEVDDIKFAEIELDEDADLEVGDYKWTGTFEYNDDVKKSLSKGSYFNEFAIALAIKDEKAKTKIEYCHAQNPTAAAMIFKKLDKESVLDCFSTNVTSFHTAMDEFDFHPQMTFSVILTPSPIPVYKFKLLFETKKDSQFDDIGDDKAVILFEFPEEFAGQGLKEETLCAVKFDPDIKPTSCKYDDDNATLTYETEKKNIKEKQISITLDLTNKYLKSAPIGDDEFEFGVYIAAPKKEGKKAVLDTSALTGKLLSLDTEKASCVAFIKQIFDAEVENKKTDVFPIVSGFRPLKNVDESALYYTLTPIGSHVLMTFNLRVVSKMENNLITLNLGYQDYGYLNKPDRVDLVSGETPPENKGVRFAPREINVEIKLDTGLVSLDPNQYLEHSIVFKTEDGSFDRIYKKKFFTATYSLSGRKERYLVKTYHLKPTIETAPVPVRSSGPYSIIGPYYLRGDETSGFMFKVTSLSENQMVYHFKFNGSFELEEPAGSYTIGNETTPFDFSSDGEGSFYLESTEKHKNIDILVHINFKLEDVDKIESVDFGMIRNYKDMKYFNPKYDEYVFKAHLVLKDIKTQPNYIVPCVNAYSWMYSSKHRSGENDVYLFSRLSDCKRPWMPFNYMLDFERLELSVATEKKTPATTTLLERISLSNPKTEDIAKKLMKANKFYEHFLYIIIDTDAFDAIKAQLISVGICGLAGRRCKGDDTEVLKLYFKTIFSKTKTDFTKFVLAYQSRLKLNFYTVDNIDSEPVFNIQLSIFTTKSDDILKNVLGNALYNTKNSVTSSFSVIAVLGEDIDNFTKALKSKYKLRSDPKLHASIPYYVDIIRVDASATIEEGVTVPTPRDVVFTREMLKKDYTCTDVAGRIKFARLHKREFYQHPTVSPTIGDHRTIQFNDDEIPKLQGSYKDSLLPKSQFEYMFYFGLAPKIEKITVKKINRIEAPVITEFKNGLSIANSTLKTFVGLAGATSFQIPKDSLDVNSFSLRYRGVDIGKHMIMSSFAGPEKLYGECDLLSLYKYFPTTPHFTSKKPVAPLVKHERYLFSGNRVVKYGAYGGQAANTMFIEVATKADKLHVIDSNLPSKNFTLYTRLMNGYYSREEAQFVSKKVKEAEDAERNRKQKPKENHVLTYSSD